MSAPRIAIVGMSGSFPDAPTPEALWTRLLERHVATREPPPGRWLLDASEIRASVGPAGDEARDRVASTRACFVEGIPLEPADLDPLCRLVLHVGRAAWADAVMAGVDRERVGVVLANIALPTQSANDLARELLLAPLEERIRGSSTRDGATPTSPRNRDVTALPGSVLASALGLGGGSFTLDAACASSLYAIKLACDELQAGRLDAALAGGASRPDSLYTQMGFTQLRALSPSGRCAPFDARADGLVVGEGAAIFVLKRLEDALRAGDRVLATVAGIGLSNDVGGALLSPASEGQLRAMRAAYGAAGWSPQDVDLIECHGTGTPTGDAVELASLRALWDESGWRPGGVAGGVPPRMGGVARGGVPPRVGGVAGGGVPPQAGGVARGGVPPRAAQCVIGSVKASIGHLLTAAGAAGLAKVLLALRARARPPQAGFERAALLDGGPFEVAREPRPWPRRDPRTPRRAAVSGFGFGGINAHLLVEEWDADLIAQPPAARVRGPRPAIAIVGMEARFGTLGSLRAFQEAVLTGKSDVRDLPRERWRGVAESDWLVRRIGRRGMRGAYLEAIEVEPGALRIPPKELSSILPQQLLMLLVTRAALADARLLRGFADREARLSAGVVIGMGLDFSSTNFHMRWASDAGHPPGIRDAIGPALDASRTLGALGGMIASRIAREFGFGGPSFGVSAEGLSGLRALEVAARALERGEVDLAIAGAVDVAGDVRAVLSRHAVSPFSSSGAARPFDAAADGAVPGEGAAALVLKRLDDARRDGDRVYALVRGLGTASSGGAAKGRAYRLSLDRAVADAAVEPRSIGLVEAHGSGDPGADALEVGALAERLSGTLGSTKGVIGDAGAAAGMASLVKASLCLFHETLPPLPGLARPCAPLGGLRIPDVPLHWLRDRADGPRRAVVAAMASDGGAAHAVLEGVERAPLSDAAERHQPTGARPEAIFAVEADDAGGLARGLDALESLTASGVAGDGGIESLARAWLAKAGQHPSRALGAAIIADSPSTLRSRIRAARGVIASGAGDGSDGREGIFHAPRPIGREGDLAFVFPGSGSHFAGMGRELLLHFPEVARAQDAENERLCSQLAPCAGSDLGRDTLATILGTVAFGALASDALRSLGLAPRAAIGYSLGESTALFALRAWRDRDEMWRRMRGSPLFRTQLAGTWDAARRALSIPAGESIDWRVVLVNRPAGQVRAAIAGRESVFLLIVNADDECVIGGLAREVEALVRALGADAVPIEGVPAVHCAVAREVADEYRALHLLPTTPPEEIRFYSTAGAAPLALDRESAAWSMTQQALVGFDFPALVRRAWDDGVRVFVEVGPQGACTRAIGKILAGRRHVAVAASARGQAELSTVARVVGRMIAERVPVDLGALYGRGSRAVGHARPAPARGSIIVPIDLPAPEAWQGIEARPALAVGRSHARAERVSASGIARAAAATAGAHEAFLSLTRVATGAMAQGIALEMRLLSSVTALPGALRAPAPLAPFMSPYVASHQRAQDPGGRGTPLTGESTVAHVPRSEHEHQNERALARAPAFSRAACLEFARGDISRVLGPTFAFIDAHPTRVRLPDEPLMLVDRILSVAGEPHSLRRGRVVTEHDVLAGAWYLDGGRAPVCITVEAGQADLFLSAYLGIDRETRGERRYRLLDAAVTFLRGLPRPGETVRYEIEIDRFEQHAGTYLFFFRYEATVDGRPLLRMTDGCAGFFSEVELARSTGVPAREPAVPARKAADGVVFAPMVEETIDAGRIDALRRGELERAFGPAFAGLGLRAPATIPPGGSPSLARVSRGCPPREGRMRLIDRIVALEPEGGRYGLGRIRAEADIHADDWFLTCHFRDDPVMPGTLMYECCLHTLRVLVMRMGWVAEDAEVACEPVPGVTGRLRCRGQVLPTTRVAAYEIDVKELGFRPEPYAIADATMLADGKPIVRMTDMSVQLTGLTRERLQAIWAASKPARQAIIRPIGEDVAAPLEPKMAIFEVDRLLSFSIGKPSDAFGDRYRVFDGDRRIARLPGPPFQLMSRVTDVSGARAWALDPGGCRGGCPPAGGAWIESQFDVPPDAWFFRANRQRSMAFSVLLEIALQPCGWLAAYLGSALRSQADLSFRNLGGRAVLLEEVFPDAGTLTVRARLTDVSEAGGMLLERFDMQVLRAARVVYEGETSFGFFSKEALAAQVGVRGASARAHRPTEAELARATRIELPGLPPLEPEDPAPMPGHGAALPARSYRMVDEVLRVEDGGPHGLGFLRGTCAVDQGAWFFRAHFFQDPVWPGSLGLESFLQLLKVELLTRFPGLAATHRFEPIALGVEHTWAYRGQIVPRNRAVTVEAVVTRRDGMLVMADGFLSVDGTIIYEMRDMGLRFVKGES